MDMGQAVRRDQISPERLQKLIEEPELDRIRLLGQLPGTDFEWYEKSNDRQITQWVKGRYEFLLAAGFTERAAKIVVRNEYLDARIVPDNVLSPEFKAEHRELLKKVNSPLVDLDNRHIY